MATNTAKETKTHQSPSVNGSDGGPYAGIVGVLICITAFLVCCLLFACFVVLKPNENPSPIQFFITTLLAIFVLDAIIFQIAVNNSQWKAAQQQRDLMRDALKQADRHFKITQRPVVFVDNVECEVVAGKPLHPTVTFVNKGKSLATGIRFQIHVTEPGTWDFNFTEENPDHCPFLPDQGELTVHVSESRRTLSKDELTLIDINPVFVYGSGSYSDLDGNEYEIEKWAFNFNTKLGWIDDYHSIKNAPTIINRRIEEFKSLLAPSESELTDNTAAESKE